jgi:hypothetical protein
MRTVSGSTRNVRTSPPMGMTWPQYEVRVLASLHRRGLPGAERQRDQHDLAHDGRDRAHGRRDVAGQLATQLGQPLGHLLAVAVDVGAPVELGVDDGQAHPRGGAHARDARHAIERRLDGEADKLLHLLGRHAAGFRQHCDQRLVEVREDIDRRAPGSEAAVSHQQRGDGQHEEPVTQAGVDDPVEHGRPSQRICAISGAPSTTTRLSAARPRVTSTVLASKGFTCTGCGV